MINKTDFSQFTSKQVMILQVAEHFIEAGIRKQGSVRMNEVTEALKDRLGWLLAEIPSYKINHLMSLANNLGAFENCSFELVRGVGFRQRIGGVMMKELTGFRETLSNRDLDIFERRITVANPVTLNELAQEYGITRERVRQIQKIIESKMKQYQDSGASWVYIAHNQDSAIQ